MNTLMVYNRLLRPLKVNSLEGLTINDAQDLVEALNLAMDEFATLAPDRYRRRQIGLRLRAPLELEADVESDSFELKNVNNLSVRAFRVFSGTESANGVYLEGELLNGAALYRNTLSGAVIQRTSSSSWELLDSNGVVLYRSDSVAETPDLIDDWTVALPNGVGNPPPVITLISETLSGTFWGCSVRVEGDPRWNRVDGENRLLLAYQGQPGRRKLTVYSDVLPLNLTVERVYQHPRRDDGRELAHIDPWHGLENRDNYLSYHRYEGHGQDRAFGEPTRYRVLEKGNAAAGAISVPSVLLVEPVPTMPIGLTLGVVHYAAQFDLRSLHTAVEVPVPETLVRSIIIPIAWGYLIDSEAWRDAGQAKNYENRAAVAREKARLLPEYFAVPGNEAGTPRGF